MGDNLIKGAKKQRLYEEGIYGIAAAHSILYSDRITTCYLVQ